jgi:proteasome accessory factor B
VGGFDLDRQAPRLFRVSRVVGDVEPIGPAGDYEVPEGTDMRKVARSLFEPEPEQTALLRVRPGRGQSLRREAVRVEPADDFDTVEVRFHSARRLAAEIASYGTDVVAVSPSEVRSAVIEHLNAAIDGSLGAIG